MSTNPNTVKSQDDTSEDELGRTMTLLRAIEQLEKTECELEKVEKENELFKEIIKDEMIKNGEIIEEIERLQKQLDIAVKCLKQYADRDNWYNTYRPNSLDECPISSKDIWKKEYGYKQAEKVLEKIEELNRCEK